MPIYDYVCESCGHVTEVIHGISAPGPSTCERCGGSMKRALSAPAIVFKGSGWAKKDARDARRSKTPTSATEDKGTHPPASDGPASTDASTGTAPASSTGSDGSASGPSAAGSTPATSASTSGGSGATTG